MTDHAGIAHGGSDSHDRMTEWPTGRLLSTAARLVENAWHDALDKQGLTHAGMIVLHLLGAGPLTQTTLANRARVQAQTMSRTIERLERAGFVGRNPDPKDGRRQVVTLTDAGRLAAQRTRSLEAELFPQFGGEAQLRATLLDIIRSSSESRWGD
jgi:MarR family transcriptional regulator, organic hydroperoxide resistance regulator